MSNNITIELCKEDRARLDRLAEALDRLLPKCDACAKGVTKAVAAYILQAQNPDAGEPKTEPEPVTPTTKEKPTEAPQEAQKQAPEQPAEESTEPKPEDVAQEIAPAPKKEEAPTVTLAQIQKKVVQLAAGAPAARKAKVREIVSAYAPKVSELPADKWDEVWDKLNKLESEG